MDDLIVKLKAAGVYLVENTVARRIAIGVCLIILTIVVLR